jgi:TolB-like protein/class 3 adenylate cyclase
MSAEVKKEIHLEIAHVLFIDVVGFSKLLINDQSEILEQLNQLVRETPHFREAEAAGKLIRLSTGDGMALVFSNSAEAPVECALEISKALQSYPQIQLRMGVHSGPVNAVSDVNDRSNVTGAGINMAQRVMDCGDAGHILLSRHVAEDLEQYRQWQPCLHDLGECEVKHGVHVSVVNLYTEELGNPERPEKFKDAAGKKKTTEKRAGARWALIGAAVLIIAAVAIGLLILLPKRWPTVSTTSTAIPEKSIAVLPFENLSRDPDNAYFATGIQDEILTRLAKIRALKVISRTSTQQYGVRPGNLPEIARQLAVANILEGSVQKAADQAHINVQLIRAASDEHLWAESYDRKLDNIFGVEGEVATAVAEALTAKLTGAEKQTLEHKPTNNSGAYDAYLRGLGYSLRPGYSEADNLGAIKYFREAVRLDPKFALAWAWLERECALGYFNQIGGDVPALREAAKRAGDEAVKLQPDLGEAYLAQGYVRYYCERDYDSAIALFEKAGQILPNNSQIPEALGLVCRRKGQWQLSLDYFRQAIRFDPRDAALLALQAETYKILRQFRVALKVYDQVLDIIPDNSEALASKAAIAQAEGDLPRAAALLTPLHPNGDDSGAVETQVYQAILERRPAQIIPRLKEILAKPDPALGYTNGELRFYLGWAQEVGGDHAAAKESWKQARSELESFLKEQPENFDLIGDLALTNIGLGDKAAALALSERAMAVNPIGKDALAGPAQIDVLARVAAQVGEPDRAIAALQKLLSIPYQSSPASGLPLTPALLRLDPMFDPLRNDPRFQKLVASPAPKAADK